MTIDEKKELGKVVCLCGYALCCAVAVLWAACGLCCARWKEGKGRQGKGTVELGQLAYLALPLPELPPLPSLVTLLCPAASTQQATSIATESSPSPQVQDRLQGEGELIEEKSSLEK